VYLLKNIFLKEIVFMESGFMKKKKISILNSVMKNKLENIF
jgi:hypothetical protein